MLISIITATYNSGTTLRDTLESVLAQTHRDFEHIIIDGGSKDDTLEIIREYESRYGGRLRWVSEADHGIYDAMNKGIKMASGEVVGILNSDDFYSSPEVLARVNSEIGDVDAVYGDVHYINRNAPDKCVRYYSSKGFKRWKMRLGYMPAHPSFYCRRAVYSRFGLFDTSFHVAADFEQLLRLIYVNRIYIKYLPLDFVTMRTGGASTSGLSSHKKILRDHLRAYRKNHVSSNALLDSIRYIFKTAELAKGKLLRGSKSHQQLDKPILTN